MIWMMPSMMTRLRIQNSSSYSMTLNLSLLGPRRLFQPRRSNHFFRLRRPEYLLLIPEAIHDLYHLVDWTSWGLHSNTLDFYRLLLYPLYGEHNDIGFFIHAVTQILVWIFVGITIFRHWFMK